MTGSILQAARNDSKSYVKAGGFESQITLSTKDGITAVNIKGFHANRNIVFDPDEGNTVSAQQAHITIDEVDLDDSNYPYRNANGDLNILNHRVTVNDSSGSPVNYSVMTQHHDRSLGLIMVLLSRFN